MITFDKRTSAWAAVISMGTTTEVLASTCLALAGGSITGPHIPKAASARPSWLWAVKGRAIGPLIESMWPYIVLKRPQAALLHRLRSEIAPGARPGEKGRSRLDDGTRYRRETMRLAVRALNHRGTDPLDESHDLAIQSARLLDLIRPPVIAGTPLQ